VATGASGDWSPTRLVVFEFPSREVAQSFFQSPQYQPLKAMRHAASDADIVGVEGV
jgi:uncharacterized protein (DUF1330 family)